MRVAADDRRDVEVVLEPVRAGGEAAGHDEIRVGVRRGPAAFEPRGRADVDDRAHGDEAVVETPRHLRRGEGVVLDPLVGVDRRAVDGLKLDLMSEQAGQVAAHQL